MNKRVTNILRLLQTLALLLFASHTWAQPVSPQLVRELAPEGTLRAAINFGNPVLAQRDATTGEPRGISVDLSRELARRLGVPVELVPFEAAGKVADAAKAGKWDIAFLAIDPGRANDVAFTAPYVVIEGTYLVPADSPLRTIDDVDRAGVRIAVGKGSAYDLYLTRTIKNAQLVRAPTSPTVIDVFRDQKLEVAAGVRQQLIAFAFGQPDLRVMDGRFMVIEQAIGTPKGRQKALEFLKRFVEDVRASGFVAHALARSNQRDALVAVPVEH
ncbi:ABC transporter substrate-binding protein [Caballeronia calidae]|nr:ABC transporter substrate-binding protein [Caballeronia calidae]